MGSSGFDSKVDELMRCLISCYSMLQRNISDYNMHMANWRVHFYSLSLAFRLYFTCDNCDVRVTVWFMLFIICFFFFYPGDAQGKNRRKIQTLVQVPWIAEHIRRLARWNRFLKWKLDGGASHSKCYHSNKQQHNILVAKAVCFEETKMNEEFIVSQDRVNS